MLQALWIQEGAPVQAEWPGVLQAWREGGGLLWVDLNEPTPEQMEELRREFGLSPFVVRACLHHEHRPKLKEFRDHFILVLNAVARGASENGQQTEMSRWRAHELNIIAGPGFVLTVHQYPIAAVSQIFGRYLREQEGRPQVDQLVFAIADAVTAGYYLLLDRMDRAIEELEQSVFLGMPGGKTIDRLLDLKKHLVYLRRTLGPQRDAIGTMMRRELPQIPAASRAFAVDLYEHTLRLYELTDTYRDLIGSTLDAYRTAVSQRTNEVMKTLTIVSTIMLPLTLISGIFGMNFAQIPLAEWRWGFAIIIALMGALGVAMAYFFRRRGWM